MEYYLWKAHVGHQLEVRPSTRTAFVGMDEEQEETIVVDCLTCKQPVGEYGHEIALRWSTNDIRSSARLSVGEADIVLEELERSHDATIGVNLRVIESTILWLFPEADFEMAD